MNADPSSTPRPSPTPSQTHQHGLNLLELVWVMALIAALCAIAWPHWAEAMQRARRTQAIQALAEVHAAQERHHSQHHRYAQWTELPSSIKQSVRHYELALPQVNAQGFVAQAQAVGAQASDSHCRLLAVEVVGLQVQQRSGRDASLSNDEASNRRCWSS